MRERPKAKHPIKKLLVISDCIACPYVTTLRTVGAGCADDYVCTAVKPNRKICGYIEYASELPPIGEFPDWCPLHECEPGMYPNAKELTKP